MEELSSELLQEDLEDITLTIADSIRERRMKAADAKETPALPLAASLIEHQQHGIKL
jgi:hypothetical protein